MDWAKLIIEIQASGLSLAQIGKETGAPISTLSDLKQRRSKEPRGALAISLAALRERLRATSAPELKEAEHV
jgi:hypothetical protein